MKILITTTLRKNLTECKIKPLIALPEVERIFYVSDRPGPFFEKVKYYCVPPKVLRFFNNNAIIRLVFKFFMVFYLSIIKRPDLLMGYSFMPHGINVALIGKILNIPSCVNVIGGALSVEGGGFTCGNNVLLKRLRNFLEKILLKIANMSNFIVVTGSTTRDFLISKGIDKEKIEILSGTIDTKRFFPDPSEKRYDLITTAELIPRKRIDVFLEIVSRLKKDGFKIKAVILGDGELRRYLEDLSKRLGLEEIVQFAGFDSDVEKYLNVSRIFLLPTQNEGLSVSMLEAMSCGLVPVVSKVDDLGDAVKDGVNGRLLDKHDIDGFVSAISELLKDQKILEFYSKKAIEVVRESFSIESAAKKWKKILSNNIRPSQKVTTWYFNRLKSMSILEIGYRLLRILRLRLLSAKFLLLRKNAYLSPKASREARFFVDKKDIDFIRQDFIKVRQKGLSEIRDIDWYNDPVSNARCKGAFRDDTRHRIGFYQVEIRRIWELNRFQWLVSYAQQYAIERDEAVAEKIVSVLKDWIEKNPTLKGINWSDSLEVSLRLLSWAWIYFLIKDSRAFHNDFEHIFLRSIYFQVNFIESNLSRYSSANNHLIGEGMGLFITGVLFPQLKGAGKRLKKGKAILEQEIEKQVYPDGVSKEQSTGYHEFVTDLYLISFIIARKNNIEFSDALYSRLEKMCEFLMHMTDKNGNLPSIGDSDGGVVIRLDTLREGPNAVSVLNTASVIFNRRDFKKYSIDGKTLWLLGRKGYDRFSLLKKASNVGISKGFGHSGYYIMRHKDLFLSFDCGALGYLSLAAHGHADSLAITLNIGDRDILIDPGTYLYRSGNGWRDYFRSTKAHNTIRIDRLDQSEIKGPFLWDYKADAFVKSWSPNGGYDKVCGYHTGYARLDDPVVHAREVVFDKLHKEIIIDDTLVSKKEHFAELFFHLHPDCILTRIEPNTLEILNKDTIIQIDLDPRLCTSISNGDKDPICGWYSGGFGDKVKTSTICAETYFKGNTRFVTRILVRDKR